ncbi:TIGR02266 family protein [Sorangium sp. So ce321]|uniref:TIGR02266 family protein n=1 Tax=Sorangium sp. So ce321 TaxID=3133300 RepID=UPI003F5E47E4
MAQDTRKDPRARVLQMTVRYKSATVDEFIEHHSHDVSRGGIFIKTPSPFPAGTLLKFEIRLQDEQAVIAGVGRVVWKREPAQASDAHPSGMGVKFIKIDEKSKAVITRLVDAQQGAGSAFEAGITDRSDLGDEVHEAALAPAPAAANAPQAEPAGSKAAQVKRASTMLGLGAIGAKGDAGKSEGMKKADLVEAGSFFPQTNPEKEMPPPDERTMMKQAAELLKQALAEAGGSLEEIGASKEPLIATPPKRAEPEPTPVPVEERVKPLAEPAAMPVVAVAQLANEREARDDAPAAEARPARVAAARRPAEATDRTPAEEVPARPARQEAKAVEEQPKAKPAAAAKPKEEKAVAAKAATAGKAPLAQEEESSGTGRLLTILLVAAALCGALWLVFGQSDPKPPAPAPVAPTTPEQPAAAPAVPQEKPEPTPTAPAATDTTTPPATAAPTATGAPAAPTASATAPVAAPTTTVEPAAPTATAEPAAPTATAEPAAPTATAEPAAPKTTAAPAAPKPRPRPAAPKPPKSDDPYG